MNRLLLLLFSGIAFSMAVAQTNEPYITIKTSSGVISNAVVVRVSQGRLIYKTPTGGGSVLLSELPRELQQQYGYDPAIVAQDKAKAVTPPRSQPIAAASAPIPYWVKDKAPISISGSVIETGTSSIKVVTTRRIPQYAISMNKRGVTSSKPTGYKEQAVTYNVVNYPAASRPLVVGSTVTVSGIEGNGVGTEKLLYYTGGGGAGPRERR